MQRQVELTIISTPPPDDKNTFNLLILNDGQDMDKLRIQHTVDSMYKNGLIKPLVVVGVIHPEGETQEKYSAFIDNELYPFIKKKSGVRKFNSVTIGGWAHGGSSAFDIGWEHNDKIDMVGVLSGTFDTVMMNKVTSSHKRLHPRFWFYAGPNEGTAALINILKTKKSITDIEYLEIKEGKHDPDYWSRVFPSFLLWADGK